MPRCAVCGSVRFTRDRTSGALTCEQGHVLAGYVQESRDVEDFQLQGQRRDTQSKKGPGRRKAKPREQPYYAGDRARFLRAECLQLVLRMQIRALIDDFGFPSELESVARDLWIVYIESRDLKPTPLLETIDRRNARKRSPVKEVEDDLATVFEEDQFNGGEAEMEVDEELEALRASQAQTPAPADEDEDGDGEAQPVKKKKSSAGKKRTGDLAWPDLLAITYLACLILRLPVMASDVYRWAETGRLPYLNALAQLPPEMLRHLDKSGLVRPPESMPDFAGNHSGLNFVERIRSHVEALGRTGIDIPELNALPVLWRLVKALGLPPLFYLLCKRLLELVDLDLSYGRVNDKGKLLLRKLVNAPSEVSLPKGKRYIAGGSLSPEVALAAGIVVTAKLVWGLDGKPRRLEGVLASLPDQQSWLATLDKLEQVRDPDDIEALYTCVASHLRLDARRGPVQDLDGDRIDDYLDFAQDFLLSGHHERTEHGRAFRKRNNASKLLPLEPRKTSAADNAASVLDEVIAGAYGAERPARDQGTLEPGQDYPRYAAPVAHSRRVFAEDPLPRALQRLYDLLAKSTKIAAVDLEPVVERLEDVLEKIAKAPKRSNKEATAEPMNVKSAEVIQSSDEEE